MFKTRQLPKKSKRSLFLPCVCSWMILTVFVSGGTQSMKVMLKTFCRWLPWHRTFCFKLTWKSMRKVASLALLYLTAHHIMASINSYFHLLPAKWRNESKSMPPTLQSSTAVGILQHLSQQMPIWRDFTESLFVTRPIMPNYTWHMLRPFIYITESLFIPQLNFLASIYRPPFIYIFPSFPHVNSL